MNTITQRLREIAKVLAEDAAARRGIGLDKAAELYSMAAELEAPATDPLPVAWIRWRSDGGYEGPLMHDQMEDVRKRSGAWTPLYRHPPTEVAALQEQINTAKPLDDPRLQELFGCAIGGALTIGYQGGAAAPDGHWLKRWWEKGRSVAERENSLQARINALEARQVPASASDEYAVVWPHGVRFVANTLKSAQDYMIGAILSCAARGVEPPVIVRYVPAEAVPYEPQQDPSKERP